jgi:GT2 family glycosyltransferase
MKASVIIPIWNGAAVIGECLDALFAQRGSEAMEVIAVDNASRDDSAAIVSRGYPQATLLRQPVNLGFAGGVNAGISAAHGDVLVLLNQDCLLQENCLATLLQGLLSSDRYGIAGCTLLNADGAINHAGACLELPLAYGVHLTTPTTSVSEVEYVTGAVFAFRRSVWQSVGAFDEGYFPAYYEETDFCYRARARGYGTAYVPDARAIHLLTGREWQRDPVKTWANQNRSRFRFVCKHYTIAGTSEFFRAECQAIEDEVYLDQALGRALAARDTLGRLAQILARRQADLGGDVPFCHERLLQEGFVALFRQAYSAARRLSGIVDTLPQKGPAGPQSADEEFQAELASIRADMETGRLAWRAAVDRLQETPEQQATDTLTAAMAALGDPGSRPAQRAEDEERQAAWQRLETDLLTQICFRSPLDTRGESRFRRFLRLLVMRPLSIATGRDFLLRRRLAEAQRKRLDEIIASAYHRDVEMRQLAGLCREQLDLAGKLAAEQADLAKEMDLLLAERHGLASRRLFLLETLIRYDYR